MTTESIDTWLKAVADNKITSKNAWDAPIIDHFSNIEEFRGVRGINFQRATTTLDGCIKVYSTRADTVIDGTFKLLETLGTEEAEPNPKQIKKRGGGTIEKNVDNLNLKDIDSPFFIEPSFFQYKESFSIFSLAKIKSSGLLTTRHEKPSGEVLNLRQYPVDALGLVTDNHICPTLNELNPDISRKLYEINIEPEVEDSIHEGLPELDNADSDNSAGCEVSHAIHEVEITPFGYLKGWAGPSHWKISRAKKEKENKAREKYRIDFSQDISDSMLYDIGNTLISTKEIVERRNKQQKMPEDFRVKSENLYHFMVRDGSFAQKDVADVNIEQKINDLSICDASIYYPIQDTGVNNEEIEIDVKNIENPKMTKKLLQSYRRVVKKIDIRRLQENVLKSVNEHKNISLETVCREVPMMYGEKESEDISVHYCFLSLLFLAHEKNLEINGYGSNLSIRSNNM